MKLTKTELREIIKEEIQRLNEGIFDRFKDRFKDVPKDGEWIKVKNVPVEITHIKNGSKLILGVYWEDSRGKGNSEETGLERWWTLHDKEHNLRSLKKWIWDEIKYVEDQIKKGKR